MNRYFYFFVLVFLNCCLSNALYHKVSSRLLISKRAKIKKEINLNLTNYVPNVHNVSGIYACDDKTFCLRINEFEIDTDFENNCYEEFIPIYFKIQSLDNVQSISHGYLNPHGSEIEDLQKGLNICKRIKRFNINNDKVLFIVGRSLDLLDRSVVDKAIVWELFVNFEIKAFFLFILDLYDEENDTIFKTKAISDAINYLSIIIAVYFFLSKLNAFLKRKKCPNDKDNDKKKNK